MWQAKIPGSKDVKYGREVFCIPVMIHYSLYFIASSFFFEIFPIGETQKISPISISKFVFRHKTADPRSQETHKWFVYSLLYFELRRLTVSFKVRKLVN